MESIKIFILKFIVALISIGLQEFKKLLKSLLSFPSTDKVQLKRKQKQSLLVIAEQQLNYLLFHGILLFQLSVID